ncbi:MAG: hypothetical protein U0105_06865 [Candidatus Obscuribacterales bacterium]
MRHRFFSLLIFPVVACVCTLAACNPATPVLEERTLTHNAVIPELGTAKPVIPAIINVKVADPDVVRFLKITDHIELSAIGKLKPGTFVVNGRPITIKKVTDFKLDISMPIDDPTVLSTERATGTLWTSEEVLFMNLPLPKTIEIKNGKATSNVDLLRMLSMFFVNALENQTESAKQADLRQILDVLVVKSATMRLTPGADCYFDKKKLHIGKNSIVQLRDVVLDGELNYKGTFIAQLNFLNGCDWIGEKVDVLFNGGSANLKLNATRVNGDVKLTLARRDAQVTMADCLFKFGKVKRSSAHSTTAVLRPTELTWSKPEGAPDSHLHLVTPLGLSNTKVCVKTDTQQTDATFPGVAPAVLTVDIDSAGRRNTFSTLNPPTASVATVDIHRPKTKVRLDLTNAKVDKIAWSKHGDLDFNLSRGKAELQKVYWSTDKKTFTLTSTGASVLELPAGMSLNLSKQPGNTKMVLPIAVKMGSASLSSTAGSFSLSNLNGQLLIACDPDVSITSDMDFAIDQSKLLGDEKAVIKARGLRIESNKGSASAHIKTVAVTVSQDALREAILKRVPKEKDLQLNKVLSEKKWRYRNFKVADLHIRNVQIDGMQVSAPNTLKFSIKGDLSADGTVDKGGLMAIFKEDAATETRPWSASASVEGTGTVTYEIKSSKSLSETEIEYHVAIDLPVREDINVDWSQVNDGLFKETERKAVVNSIQELNMPIQFDGNIPAFKGKNQQLRFMRVTGVNVVPAEGGCEMRFSADANM